MTREQILAMAICRTALLYVLLHCADEPAAARADEPHGAAG